MKFTSVVTVAAVASASPLAAQVTQDAAVMRMYQAGTEVGRESFARTGARFESTVEIPLLQARLVRTTVFNADGTFAKFESEVYLLSNDSLVSEYRAVQQGDSIRWRQVRGDQDTSGTVAGEPDAIVISQSTAVFADLAYRAHGRDTVFDLWSPEAGAVMQATVRHTEGSVEFTLGPLPLIIRLRPDGRVGRIDIPAQRVNVERVPPGVRLPSLPGLERPKPDYSAPPGAIFAATEVRVPVTEQSGEQFELAGTLTLPRSGAPHPVVITITGSGGQDRDENLWPLVPDYHPYAELAARLASAGIAVLRTDDRGVGGSGGSRDSATSVDFATDVHAQIAWLREHPQIDGSRVALLGHSEGGVIGPLVAAADPAVAALVVLAGPSQTGEEIIRYQLTRPIETAPGLNDQQRATLRDSLLVQAQRDLSVINPWMRYFWSYDPLETAQRVGQPVLILHGEFDRQVTAEQAGELAAAIRQGGNRDVTTHVFPKLNHLFLMSIEDGSPHEYLAIEDASLPSEVLDMIAEWLADKLRTSEGS